MKTPGVGLEVVDIVPVTLDEAERDATLLPEAIGRGREVAKHLARDPFAARTSPPAETHPVVRVHTETLLASGFNPIPASVRVGVHGGRAVP